MNKGMRSRQHHVQKMRFGIKKIHHYYATVVNPGWSYYELTTGIVERLSNKQLKYITENNDSYYNDIRELCVTELMEREVLGKEMIREDHEKVSEAYRKAPSRSGLCLRKRS